VAGTILDRLAGMDRLCQDVVDTVAVATGRTVPEPERLDLADLLTEVCSIAGVTFPPRLPVIVDADPQHLRQAVTALLNHVLRYVGPSERTVALQVVHGGALVTVRADGVSLTAGEAAALFEPFGSAARGDGNGLALYVVRTLVVASGGQVGVAGDQGSTVFWVRLPLAP
jgi:signal transduction histidine kinase